MEALSWILVAITIACAMGVVSFESPQRSAVALLGVGVGGGGLVIARGAPDVGGAILWIVGSGALLLLLTSLLLNLRDDDVSHRRLSVRRTLASMAVAYVGAAVSGLLFGDPLRMTSNAEAPMGAVGTSLFGTGAVALVLIALGLLALVPAALLLARRQA